MSMPDNTLQGGDSADDGQKVDDQKSGPDEYPDPREGAEVIEQNGNAIILRHEDFVSVVSFAKERGLNATFSGGTVDGNIADAVRFIGSQYKEHSTVFLPGDKFIREYKGSFILDQEGNVVIVHPDSDTRMSMQPNTGSKTGKRRMLSYESQLRAAIKHADKLADEGGRQHYLKEYSKRNRQGRGPDDNQEKLKI